MKKTQLLTRKQQAFVQQLVDNPKISATEAAARAYNVGTRKVASTVAAENMAKPSVIQWLEDHAKQAENTVTEIMTYALDEGKRGGHVGAAYAGVGLSAANSVLDRVHGKATQRVEMQTKAVVITIDLSRNDDVIDSDEVDHN